MEYPEIDRAGWFDITLARKKILKGQAAFLDRLIEVLNCREEPDRLSNCRQGKREDGQGLRIWRSASQSQLNRWFEE
jgi:hypothetical protein